MERITFNTSLSGSLLRAWAMEFNQAHRDASINASMWRLRFAAVFIFGTLVFLAGRAFAETNADAPTGKPDAVIDLATKEGVDLVKGQWRYSDTKIIPGRFQGRRSGQATDRQTNQDLRFYAARWRRRFRRLEMGEDRSDNARRASLDWPTLFQLVSNQYHDSRRA